ncbi:MAG TPA: hypothetical protein DD724_06775 [Lactobacillus acetotolerans]|jgi:gas vesicle protein|nr:hypothetical protein [Lactobacillus acetotolerans]
MTKKELKEHMEYLKDLAKDVGTKKYFVVVLALEELENLYDQKQRIYKAIKKLKTVEELTINKNYNISSQNANNLTIHPLVKEYSNYSDKFLKALEKIVKIITELTDKSEEAERNKLRSFQNRAKEMRGEGAE